MWDSTASGISGAADETIAAAAAWRIRQISIGARLVALVCRLPGGLKLARALQTLPVLAPAYRALVGCYRPFATLHDANQAAAPYAAGGHANASNADEHLRLNQTARPSDYAALFHLRPRLAGMQRIFDLGGNVGNLFYCYRQYLDPPPDLIWQVQDVPQIIALGRQLAAKRGARQLEFTENWTDASGADLLIASGSLHYFALSLPEMLADLTTLPANILVNRTPLTDGKAVATVQDARTYRVSCMLFNRQQLLHNLAMLGYELVDSWATPELALRIPGYPQHDILAYSGMFLRRQP